MPTKEIQGARKVLEAIIEHAPTDHDGELLQPYRGWRDRLVKDLEKFYKWEKGGKK